jgi:2-hydroxychromene-2-carboxylate isomerase
MPVTVDYYMTLNSPWTYLGSALLAEIARRNDASINIKPCNFGPIFEQTGGAAAAQALAAAPRLSDYGIETLARCARHSGDA